MTRARTLADYVNAGDELALKAPLASPTFTGTTTVSGDLVPATPLSHRNMIINGDMKIFQRTAVNTEVVATSSGAFCADRFRFWSNVGSSLPEIQVRNDDAPAGFVYSLKRTTNSASSIAASSYDAIIYRVEGNDVAHLNYGTANAKTLTLSFYVKCSIAGTFSITFDNQAHNRGLVKNIL